ncbi:MAG: hypothetical protein QNJ30_26385 [Kiloniellales bacterium]|nr:hypothetical protein [Kiloniellales bacterium]
MRGRGERFLAELPEPRTAGEVAALARALEREAARRYLAFAEDARGIASPEVPSLLGRIAEDHAERAGRLSGEETAAVRLPEDSWPQLFAEEETAVCNRAGLTPYKVLAFAVALAQRCFALYSYLAAAAQDPAARAAAERRAEEELLRAAGLRRERRRAYRVERRSPAAEPYPPPALVETLADLIAAALVVEEALARHLAEAMKADPLLSASLEATRRQVETLQRARGGAGEPGGALAEALARLAQAGQKGDTPAKDRAGLRRHLLAACESAFTFYDAVASAAASEAVLLKAQELSQAALERVKRLATA